MFSAIVTACGSGGGADPLDGGSSSTSSTSSTSSSSGASGSTSTSSSSGSTGSCGTPPPPEVFTVPYQPRTDCIEDGGADAAVLDGGPDAACEGEEPKFSMCQRHCNNGPGSAGGECTLSQDGKMVTCTIMNPCGRRFEGLAAHPNGSGDLGAFLASSAYLEAASVHAFRWMAEEIEAHGLGDDLAAWARRAAREEARHARMMTSLARTLGHPTIPKVKKPRCRMRSLEAMALENAVEGCVRETYGALLATFQATHAHDPRVRATFAAIAEDETSHAALAWSLAEALEARLDPAARKRVHTARTHAFGELQAAVGSVFGEAERIALGHPTNAVAVRMSDALTLALAA